MGRCTPPICDIITNFWYDVYSLMSYLFSACYYESFGSVKIPSYIEPFHFNRLVQKTENVARNISAIAKLSRVVIKIGRSKVSSFVMNEY